MKKAIPWVVGIILILFGVLSLANSIIAGLLSLIAGLLLLPPVVKLLASKEQLSFLATNGWASKVIATVLVIVWGNLLEDLNLNLRNIQAQSMQ